MNALVDASVIWQRQPIWPHRSVEMCVYAVICLTGTGAHMGPCFVFSTQAAEALDISISSLDQCKQTLNINKIHYSLSAAAGLEISLDQVTKSFPSSHLYVFLSLL